MRMNGIRWAAALALAAAVSVPVFASPARSVTRPDGSVVTVWDQQGRARAGGSAGANASIHYSIVDAAGTRGGVIAPTGDPAQDLAPCVALDDTGAAVVVWSRFDGSYKKIAYARLGGDGTWSGIVYLTFGPGDDESPLLADSLSGSFLFFTNRGKYQYAPLDLQTGRLNAAPRGLSLGLLRRDIEPVGGGFTADAGVDTPVTFITTPARDNGPKETLRYLGGSFGIAGGVDAPITGHNSTSKASVWGSGSRSDCVRLVLALPSANLRTIYLFRFSNGSMSLLNRVSVPAAVQDRFADDLAASYLPLVCN